MGHAEPSGFLNPTTGRREPLPPSPHAPLKMEALGLDPAKPADRRKWEEEEARQWRAIENRRLVAEGRGDEWRDYDVFPSLVPGGGRDPQAFVLAEDPLFGQWAGLGESPVSDPYSDEHYQEAMGSGMMKTAKGERPPVRDMTDIPINERRSHYEGLSLDDRAKRAVGELAGAQMLLTEIDADLDAVDNGLSYSSKVASPGVDAHYRKLQVKKSVTEDFVHQSRAILQQLRRQQYRRALKARSDTEFGEQF